MAWVRIDDQFTDHPKAAEAGPLGIAMQVAALCYSNRHLTDGFISYAVAARLLDWTGIAKDLDWDKPDQQVMGWKITWQEVAEKCEEAGLWDAVDGGWRIHDYLEYNPGRADALAKRQDISAKRAQAGRKGLANRWQTDSKRDSKTPSNANQNDSPNPNPNPIEKETPRAARPQDEPAAVPVVESIAQITGEKPYDILAAFALACESDLAAAAPAWKQKQLAVAKRLLEQGYGTDKVRRYIAYRLSQTWRDGTFDLMHIEKEIGTWEVQGSPERAAKNGIRPSQADHNRGGTGRVVL